MNYKYIITILTFILALTACGGGGDSSSDSPTNLNNPGDGSGAPQLAIRAENSNANSTGPAVRPHTYGENFTRGPVLAGYIRKYYTIINGTLSEISRESYIASNPLEGRCSRSKGETEREEDTFIRIQIQWLCLKDSVGHSREITVLHRDKITGVEQILPTEFGRYQGNQWNRTGYVRYLPDRDNDGIEDTVDNCPNHYNPTQSDVDGDGVGDACDSEGIIDSTDDLRNLPAGATGTYFVTTNLTVTGAWTPRNFNGILNGYNHTITFNSGGTLFAIIGDRDSRNNNGTVTNIGILGGTLAATNYGSITNTYATGDSRCSAWYCSSGGLVGRNYLGGTITNSYATGPSSCSADPCYSGGLVGKNEGTITASYATGATSCSSNRCHSGGLVGHNDGTIRDSYATGNSQGRYSGGLVGFHHYNSFARPGSITNSFATGNSTCPSTSCNRGGLVGFRNPDGGIFGATVTNSYRAQNTGTDGGDRGVHRTLAQLRCPTGPGQPCQGATTYTNWDNSIWNFGDRDALPTIKNLLACPTTYPYCRHYSTQADQDNDDVVDAADNCPTISNPDQNNTITPGDAEGDACDDPDRDGIYDISDNCPTISNPDQNNTITPGNAKGDACDDPDHDGIYDISDNCPTIPNPDQNNTDGADDGGDACDPDIDGDGYNNSIDAFDYDPTEWADRDNDQIGDNTDNCPTTPNRNQTDRYGDPSIGDACEDTDRDNILDLVDNCPLAANTDQANFDNASGDILGDVCDPDIDGDGYNNTIDAFDYDPNEWADRDNDQIGDNTDNCPTLSNARQVNLDNDDLGDACDPLTPITNTTTLQAITNGNYRITTNLAVPGPWTPIANFRGTLGTLNDNNYTITFQATQPNPPLFDTISSTATITNIGVLGSTLAYANHGTIRHSYATGPSGYFMRHGANFTGGLVAYNTGAITNSHATGDMGNNGTATVSGGLVGWNYGGTITTSYATGDSTGSDTSGGLVGWNWDSTITSSYATGDSTGGDMSGGLVGWHWNSTITSSYATGNSSSGRVSGGLVGNNHFSTINNSYATGNSSSNNDGNFSSHSGGLVGEHSGTIANSYATGNSHSNSRHQAAASGGLVGYTDGGTIIASHATGNSHSNSEFRGSHSGGLAGYNDWASIIASYATGNSRSDASGGYESASGGLIGYHRVGTITASYATGNSSSHVHDGSSDSSYSGGLIGYNRFNVITDSYATGTSAGYKSGGLVGQNWGTVNYSYATGASTCEGTGSTTADYNKRCASGGLVGQNYGTVLRAYALGASSCDPSNTRLTINSRCSSGGLVGANDGTIRYVYALGKVVGYYSGGLVGLQGYNDGRNIGSSIGNLADAYSSGPRVDCFGGRCQVGGLVGRFHSGTITRTYSTRVPWCTGVGGCSRTGFAGSVQSQTPPLSAQNSYRTWGTGTGNLGDLPRTESQLKCPTTAGQTCQSATTYLNWDNTIWNFGTSSQLPTIADMPACPSFRPNCRW